MSLWNKIGRVFLRPFFTRQYSDSSSFTLNDQLITAIHWWIQALQVWPASFITWTPSVSGPLLHVYVDASTIDQSRGAVLVTPDILVWTTKREHSDVHINLNELRAATLALATFQQFLANRHFILWTDSTAVRGWLINQKGFVSTTQSRDLVLAFWLRCLFIKATPWIVHLPSGCNVADWATRLEYIHRLAPFQFLEPVDL